MRINLSLTLTVLVSLIVMSSGVLAAPPVETKSKLFKFNASTKPDLPSVKGDHFKVYQATADSFKFCHHPCLIDYRGKLFAMWSNGKIHEDAEGQRLLISDSTDGERWCKPRALFEGGDDKIFVAAGLSVVSEKLVAWFTITGGTNFNPNTALYFSTSDDGNSWTLPTKVTSGFFINPPVQLHDGRWIMGGEYTDPHRDTKRMKILVTMELLVPTSWKEVAIPIDDVSVIGYAEPNFIAREHDTVALLRNYSGKLYAAQSTDGEEWTTAEQTAIPDSTARFATGKLPSGTYFLINNATNKQFDRSALVMTLSNDGRKLTRGMIVRSEPTKMRFDGKHKLDGWQYPHAHVWGDYLYVIYSVNKEDVFVTRIPLKRL